MVSTKKKPEAVEVDVIELPWNRADLRFYFTQKTGASLSLKTFDRWMDACWIDRSSKMFTPFDLAKLVMFHRIMQKFQSIEIAKQHLLGSLNSNDAKHKRFWDRARSANSRGANSGTWANDGQMEITVKPVRDSE